MHRCLQISEIVYNIVDMLDCNGFKTTPGRNDLLALATVSKMFTEPALDWLWAGQDSLLTLIKTLPRDLWEQSGKGKVLVGLLFCVSNFAHLPHSPSIS
jgi:hypothetical protein